MVHPTFDPNFYSGINDVWRKRGELEITKEKQDFYKTKKHKMPIKFRYRPHTKWITNEIGCYVGEHEPYVMPSCHLERMGKDIEGVRTLDTRYEFGRGAQGDILTELSQSGQFGGDPCTLKCDADEAALKTDDETTPVITKTEESFENKTPLKLKEELEKTTPRPKFKNPKIENTGVVLDSLPKAGTLMARQRTPDMP